MATISEIEKIFDKKIMALKQEVITELKANVLDKVAADVDEMKEQAAANARAIRLLEQGGSRKGTTEDADATRSATPGRGVEGYPKIF
jgi:hypothetical protein